MDNHQRINEQIYSLDYDPREILKFNGSKISNYTPKTGVKDGNTYLVVTRELHDVKGDFDVAVASGNQDVTYPGALILANSDLADGKAQRLSAARNPMKLTLNLPGMEDRNSEIVEKPDYGNVLSAMDRIMNRWFEGNKGKYEIPSNMSYKSSMVYDEKQLQITFGCSAEELANKLGIDFSMVKSGKKSVYLVQYKQIFYSASVAGPEHPADVFADNVTWENLKSMGVDNQNPPAYISNVLYGRQIYVKFESDCSAEQMEAALKAAVNIKGVKMEPDIKAKYDNVYKSIQCSLVAIGGTSKNYEGVFGSEDTQTAINAIIFENTQLSPSNLASPLSYKVVFLKDNKTANFYGMTQYVTEKVEEFRSGLLKLEHTGAYVARFYIYWEEIIGYDEKGKAIVESKGWQENGKNKTARYTSEIALGGNVRNISIKAEGKTGLVWEPWRTSLERKNLAMVPERKVSISGTTLSQKGSCNPS